MMRTHVLSRAAMAALLLIPAACQRGDDGNSNRQGGVMAGLGGRDTDERPSRNSQRESRGSSSTSDRFNRNVRIINGTDQMVVVVRARVTGMSDWGRDRIPTSILQPGQDQIVDFNDNNGECRYDLQATMQDQSRREQTNVNICQVAEWRIGIDGDVLN